MANPRWKRKLALHLCAGALAAGAGYYGGYHPPFLSLPRRPDTRLGSRDALRRSRQSLCSSPQLTR